MNALKKEAAKARRKAKLHPTDENQALYRTARNLYFHTIQSEKTNSWRRYLSTLTVDTLFQAKKYASGPRPSPLISTLINTDETLCLTNEEKAAALFCATSVATAPCDLDDVHDSQFPRSPNPSATYLNLPDPFFFSKSILFNSLKSTHPMKAPGPDRIQNWVWCLAWDVIDLHVVTLFEAIIKQGFIPPRWKVARTSMLAKPGKDDYTLPGSYRPIALLNTIGKLFEKTLTRYLSHTVESNTILNPGHYGGRPGRSSQNVLIHLVSWIKQQWKAGRLVGAIFADVKSAFPSVHHPRMLDMLEKVGLHPSVVNVIHSFLTNRSTFLAFNGCE